MVASAQGKLSFVKDLVEHGADVNAEDSVSETYQMAREKYRPL